MRKAADGNWKNAAVQQNTKTGWWVAKRLSRHQVLVGKRVLVVEDDLLIALVIEDFLMDGGCLSVRTCGTVAEALDAVRVETFDVATLDVNVNGVRVYPVADALAKRRTPFLFASGYADQAIPAGHSDWKVCAKLFTHDGLLSMLMMVLGMICS